MKKFYIVMVVLFIMNGALAQLDKPCALCLPEGITFTTQAQIDSFQINYPGCSEITGDVVINGGSAINNLFGLSNLTSIGGNLNMVENDSLSGLGGLEELTSVGYWLNIVFNSSLTSLAGLDGLTSIGGGLVVHGNISLTNLTGLDNIYPGSITDLQIVENSSLSACNVKSICDYLSEQNGKINIHDNGPGCNSLQEVKDSCEAIGIESLFPASPLIIYPNPTSTIITIKFPTKGFLSICNTNGQSLLQQELPEERTTIDVSRWIGGIYVIKVIGEKGVQVGKFIKN